MSVLFACTETSGFDYTDVESTSGPISGRSRSNLRGNSINRFDLPTALSAGWVSYQNKRTNVGSGAECTLYGAGDVPVLRIVKVSTTSLRIDYWDGAAWSTGSTFTCNQTGGNIACAFEFSTGVGGSVTYYEGEEEVASRAIGDDTLPVLWGEVQPHGNTGGASNTISAMSEIIINDTERPLLYCRVETEGPNADGADTDGSGSYADVDESINDRGATSLQLTDVGDRQSFTAPARTSTYADGVVLAVTVAADMRKGGNSPPRFRFYLTIGGVRYYSPAFDLTLSWRGYQYSWSENPATETPWTPTDAESSGLEWGIETMGAE